MKTALGIVAGVLVAFGMIWLIELVEAFLYPPVAPVDWQDRDAVGAMVAAVPIGGKLMIVGGWFLGALFGAAAAGFVARRAVMGWVPAGLVLIGCVLNLVMIPHPVGMAVAAVVLPVLGGWLGVGLARQAVSVR